MLHTLVPPPSSPTLTAALSLASRGRKLVVDWPGGDDGGDDGGGGGGGGDGDGWWYE